ncbi:MAG TPA: PEP-CTERM sorting domain-containing protein [Caldimonas sp.]|jgi:hypothetical protein|nr:PEP-CTERM sorting domain-containing protein [Caldimonas sp.]HEX2539560.1 PEP-CTERM sorting domain-containing protein [Caldimonas sp.]
MRKVLQVAAAAALLGVGSAASAVEIGGLTLPNEGGVFAVAQIYENTPTAVGQILRGYGEVDSINSIAVSSLCSGCELTYRFDGYQVTSLTATDIRFTGGVINFYLGFGAQNDFTTSNPGGSAGDLAEATNGTLFLTLVGHSIDAAGNTFAGTGINIGTIAPAGTGSGLADVNMAGGGIANAFFNTNSVPASFGGPADFLITSSFSPLFVPYPNECPAGPACLSGSADMRGSIAPIPEPETYALMLAGLGALGFVARRRRR